VIFSKFGRIVRHRTGCHTVDPFPLKTLGDRSGKNEVHSVPRCNRDIFRTKKAGDLFVPKKANLYRLIEKFDPKQRRILAVTLGGK